METYTRDRPLAEDPDFDSRRTQSLEELKTVLSSGSIDSPIRDIIERFAILSQCYSLQSCCGHFVGSEDLDDHNTKRVEELGHLEKVQYRIAYIALCVEDSVSGRRLLMDLREIAEKDAEYIQFGSADWFWQRCVNTYVLQVSPTRFSDKDSFDVSREEAIRIERARDLLFNSLRDLLSINENKERV